MLILRLHVIHTTIIYLYLFVCILSDKFHIRYAKCLCDVKLALAVRLFACQYVFKCHIHAVEIAHNDEMELSQQQHLHGLGSC